MQGVRAACLMLLALVLMALAAPQAYAQAQPGRRIALVIGNGTYTNGGVLDNPEADAEVVASKLATLGFQVTTDKNLGQSGMRDLIGAFMSRVRDGDLVLIYYAGHGIEADGRDYMLPVDVKLETPTAVQFQGIPLDMLYSDKQTFGVIIVFDACRDNPFLRRVKGAVAGTHALSPPVGALVLFSASSGDVAEDGGVDASGATRKISVFASAFNNALSVPDASIQRIYQGILREVRTQTSNRQAPQRFGDLADDFIFNASGGIPRTYQAAAPPPPTPEPVAAETRLATNTAGPPATLLRSLPTPDAAAPQSTASSALAPPVAAPPRAEPAPAPVVAPPAAAPVQEAAATPPQAPPASPAPEPVKVASLTVTPPAAAVAAAPRAPAPTELRFTIASLGENVMPPPPVLDPVPDLKLPAKFCTVEEQIAYLNTVFKPAYNVAYRNNEVAIAYLSALNGLGQEYSSRQSGFVFRIRTQFEQFAPVAAQANQTSNAVLGLDAQIRRVPVEACPR